MNNDGNSLDYIYNNFLNLMTLGIALRAPRKGLPPPAKKC